MANAAVSESAEVTVRAIASGGDGVADLPDGRVVFVPRTAPGDHARVTIEKSRSHWARATLDELLDEGEARVDARCSLYDRCGGCQLQHLPYESQLEWKGRFVADALERIGKLGEVAVPEVIPSPREWRYRTRMTFTLRRLRGGRIVAGLHALERGGHVLDIDDECLLPEQDVLDAWTALRAGWGAGARRLPSGGRLRLTLRSVVNGVELVVGGGEAAWRGGGLLEEVPGLVAIWHAAGDLDPAELVAGASAAGLGDAFEQVNPEAAELLRDHVREVATMGGLGACSVVDAYCGTGRVGRGLATHGRRVTGIELNASAAAEAGNDAPPGFAVVEGRVEDRLGDHLPCDLLIVNPPRTGLDASIPEILRETPARRVVYVSCDPATLARDLRALAPRYVLKALKCFDLFPHTAHVETVAVLEAVDVEGHDGSEDHAARDRSPAGSPA